MRTITLQRKRMALSILLVLLLNAVGMTKALAQSFTSGDLNYSINEDGTTVTLTGHFYGTNAIGTLSIPNEVTYNYQTYPVTAIRSNAFKNCTGLTGSLVIPNSVITIGDNAFQGCFAMQGSLTIGTSVTEIGITAFRNCSFHTVNYNATACPSVPYEEMGQYAIFEGCSSLETLNIGNNVQIIPDNMFRECSGFTGNLVLPNTLTTIGQYAFEGLSNLTGSLTIPNSVTTIGQYAFYYCSGFTGDLTIGNSVTSIGNSAFSGCSGFTGDLTIGNSVTSIGNSAFYGCSGFSGALTIGASVNEIGIAAFGLCYDFTVINLNATNWAIVGGYLNGNYQNPFYAYDNQIGPTNAILNIGENVQIIPERAFAGCSGLTGSVTIPNSVTTIGNSAFSNCSGFTGNLVIGNSVTSIGNSAFSNCSGFTRDLTIPNSVTSIGEYAFSYCSGFTGTLTIPNSVTTIVEWSGLSSAFWGCCNLETIIVEAGNTAYDSRDNCNALIKTSTNELLLGCKNTVIPNSVTTIGWNAFYGCSGMIGSLIIPNSVTSIGRFAFYGCSGLTSLTIGNSVTSIELSSFTDCIGLTSIQVLAGTPPNTWGYGSFGNIDYSIPVTVPCGSSSAYQNTYHWNFFTNIQEYCDPLTYSINDDGVSVTVTGHVDGTAATGELVIPETKTIDGVTYTVTKIGNNAFRNCSGLTGVLVIPNTVTTIGLRAFMNCSGFTGNLVIGNSVTSIGGYAFAFQYSGDSGFTGLTLGNSVTTIGGAAFMNCNGFAGSLILPESLTTIETNAFQNCNGFTGNLTIPAGVTSLGGAFTGCSGFTSLTMLPTLPPINNPFGSSPYDIPVTVPCGSWTLYRYAYYWTGFTNIQEDCSGTYEVIATANPAEGGRVVFGTEGTTLFADSFESYTAGGTIAVEAEAVGNDWWSTWNGQPGSDDDGAVVDYGSTRCGHLTYGNDQVLLLNKESGVYEIEFDILVPEGKNAWFSVLHEHSDSYSTTEAVKCYLHCNDNAYQTIPAPGHGLIHAGNARLADIPCVFDAWMHIRICVDIDANVARFYFTVPGEDELLLCQWPWDWSANSQNYSNGNLAAMDFWPPIDEATSEYYVDNISLKQYEVGNTMMPGNHFAQGATCTLTAIPNEDYAFINWTESGQEVSTDAEYSFTVTGDADYVANFASEGLHWDFNPEAFANSMTVMGIVMIDSVEQHNPSWEIGAFHGDECRGSARLANELRSATGQLYFVLTVYGNVDGEEITFQLYDHILEQSLDLDCSTSLGFAAGESFGDPNNLLPLNFVDGEMVQTTDLSQGYNWWSTYIEQEGINGLEMLENSLGDNGLAIRSQASGYTDYYGEDYGWWGSLTSINNESSYRVVASTPCTVTMTGTEAVPSQHPITLNHGWTWMGYVPSTAMDVNTAMAGMEASDGDMLKSQQGYADYYPNYGWYGSLNTIEPGMGLMYYSASGETVTFTYPDSNRGGELKANMTAEHNHWKPNTFAYPDNMTVMATIELDGEELNSDHYELAAFTANGECRGSVKLAYAEPLHRYVAFLTISGKDAAELNFRLYDTETGLEYYDAEESLDFVANAIVGDATDLYVVHFRGTTGLDEFAGKVQVYPNPVNVGERFSINVADDVKTPVCVEIVNALGVETLRVTSVQTPIQLTVPATAGVYTLRITVEGKDTVVRKLVVK